jgi:hypothetical protein
MYCSTVLSIRSPEYIPYRTGKEWAGGAPHAHCSQSEHEKLERLTNDYSLCMALAWHWHGTGCGLWTGMTNGPDDRWSLITDRRRPRAAWTGLEGFPFVYVHIFGGHWRIWDLDWWRTVIFFWIMHSIWEIIFLFLGSGVNRGFRFCYLIWT